MKRNPFLVHHFSFRRISDRNQLIRFMRSISLHLNGSSILSVQMLWHVWVLILQRVPIILVLELQHRLVFMKALLCGSWKKLAVDLILMFLISFHLSLISLIRLLLRKLRQLLWSRNGHILITLTTYFESFIQNDRTWLNIDRLDAIALTSGFLNLVGLRLANVMNTCENIRR